MTFSRRRFLTLSAAFTASPALLRAQTWTGYAFGAEISMTLTGPTQHVAVTLEQAQTLIRKIERTFSLFDPLSELSRLNRIGTLAPSPMMHEVIALSDKVYHLTGGLFDPTVQPLWQALARGRDVQSAQRLLGWHRISYSSRQVTVGPGQALTLNGIAQGYATDQVGKLLTAAGFEQTLVNIGEYRATGGAWSLGLSDPDFGLLGHRTLRIGAIATSSPMATTLGSSGHILHESAQPKWSTVSVEADSAALADALSTALVLADPASIAYIRTKIPVRRITLVDFGGNLRSE